MAFFMLPIQGSWSAVGKVAEQIAEKLTECTFSQKIRQFRRCQGLQLLSALVRANQEGLAKKPVRAICQSISADVDVCIEGKEKKPRYLCELLNLVHVLHQCDKDIDNASWKTLIGKLTELKDCLPSNRHFRDVKKAYNKACLPLGIAAVTEADKRYI